jgi:hypothetical protein
VHVVDLYTNIQITTIEGFFRGVSLLIVVTENNELCVGDFDGTFKVVDLFTNKIVANISTGATNRTDEFGYDPRSNTVVISSDFNMPPFVTAISATARLGSQREWH